jgi:hypothetical protein
MVILMIILVPQERPALRKASGGGPPASGLTAERVANSALFGLRWLKPTMLLIELRWLKNSFA